MRRKQISNAMCQRLGLAAAGSGQYQHRALGGFHRPPLLGIQPLKKSFVHIFILTSNLFGNYLLKVIDSMIFCFVVAYGAVMDLGIGPPKSLGQIEGK